MNWRAFFSFMAVAPVAAIAVKDLPIESPINWGAQINDDWERLDKILGANKEQVKKDLLEAGRLLREVIKEEVARKNETISPFYLPADAT